LAASSVEGLVIWEKQADEALGWDSRFSQGMKKQFSPLNFSRIAFYWLRQRQTVGCVCGKRRNAGFKFSMAHPMAFPVDPGILKETNWQPGGRTANY
jgi:hypothetical protein